MNLKVDLVNEPHIGRSDRTSPSSSCKEETNLGEPGAVSRRWDYPYIYREASGQIDLPKVHWF